MSREEIEARKEQMHPWYWWAAYTVREGHVDVERSIQIGIRGLRTYEAIRILHGLRGRNIVGADIVCPMPTVDNPNQITALTGSVLMFEMLSLIADYLRGQA